MPEDHRGLGFSEKWCITTTATTFCFCLTGLMIFPEITPD